MTILGPMDVPHAAKPIQNKTRPAWSKDDRGLIWFVCPYGHSRILTNHEFAKDGTVSPKVECVPTCPFKDEIRLVDWETNQ